VLVGFSRRWRAVPRIFLDCWLYLPARQFLRLLLVLYLCVCFVEVICVFYGSYIWVCVCVCVCVWYLLGFFWWGRLILLSAVNLVLGVLVRVIFLRVVFVLFCKIFLV
jgi:hypothetical protein